MGVQNLRQLLHDAAIRYAVLRDDASAATLDSFAEQYGEAKRRARVRREKWKERQEERPPVGDGYLFCRVEGCKERPTYRPTILFEADDEGKDPIRVETALLDVCEAHALSLPAETYVENQGIWLAITQVWTQNGLPPPDPSALIEVQYAPIGGPGRAPPPR